MFMNCIFILADRNAENIITKETLTQTENKNSFFEKPSTRISSIKDVKDLNLSYWTTVVICILFYGAINFTYNATDVMFTKYGYDKAPAAKITSLIYIAGAIISPVIGLIADIWGYRMQMMTFGIFLMVPSLSLMAFTTLDPIGFVVVLGISYAVVPAVLWTIIPLVVPDYLVGKAFGISYSLYDGVIFIVPLLYGQFHEQTNDGYMWGIGFYALLSFLSLLACFPLWVLDKTTLNSLLKKPSQGANIHFPCCNKDVLEIESNVI